MQVFANDRYAGADEESIATSTFQEQSTPSFARLPGGGYIAVWNGQDGFNNLGVRARLFDANGRPTGDEFLVNSSIDGGQAQPSAALLSSGQLVITWTDESAFPNVFDVKARVFSATGQPVGAEFTVNTTLPGFQVQPEIAALDNGGFAISWSAPQDTSGDQIRVQAFDASATKVGSETIVHGPAGGDRYSHSIANVANGYVVAWSGFGIDPDFDEGVRAQRFDFAGNKVGGEIVLATTLAGTQNLPLLASLPNGGFVAAWLNGETFGDGPRDVRAQLFDSQGNKLGAEIIVGGTRATVADLTVRPNGEILVVWRDVQSSDVIDIRAQLLSPAGEPIGEPFYVNQETRGSQHSPAALALDNGAFVVGWTDQGVQFDTGDVKQRLLFPLKNGTDADDQLVGGPNRDFIRGLSGNDLLLGGEESDELDGGLGQDTLSGEGADDRLFGGAGDDGLAGGDGNDMLSGGEGSDRLNGGAGNDLLDGGSGNNDTADYADAGAGVTVDLRLVGAQDTLAAGIDTLQGVENATGSAFDDLLTGDGGSNILIGNAGQDRLFGGGGADQLVGGLGDDLLSGGAGGDIVDGGEGSDTLLMPGLSRDYSVLRLNGQTYVAGQGDIDRVASIEFVQFADAKVAWTDLDARAQPFDGLRYIASHGDLTAAFGDDAAAGTAHFVNAGFAEGRDPTVFDPARYVAGYGDLITAFGLNTDAATRHFISYGADEGRSATAFDPFSYVAGYGDLIAAFGVDTAAATQHYIGTGFAEGRSATSFDALRYVAGYGDLIGAFGTNTAAATQHYVGTGYAEGRSATSFDALRYVAGYGDLITAFGTNTAAATLHYVGTGFAEGRSATSFDALRYIASNSDLITAFGADADRGLGHYVAYGFGEGRNALSFDPSLYLETYPDLRAAFGTDTVKATLHFIQTGYAEGRTGGDGPTVAVISQHVVSAIPVPETWPAAPADEWTVPSNSIQARTLWWESFAIA